jgi:hypothetical protein
MRANTIEGKELPPVSQSRSCLMGIPKANQGLWHLYIYIYIYTWSIGTLSKRMSLNATSIALKQSKTGNRAWTSVGWFSLFCENRSVPVLSWWYENLISFLIYNFFWAHKNWSGYQNFFFFKLTLFSDNGSHIYNNNQFSTTWLLNFSLIKISFND